MQTDFREDLAEIRNWQHQHGLDDDVRFKEINEKLDSILEVMSAFRMGGRGVMWVCGLIIALGTMIVLGMQILHK